MKHIATLSTYCMSGKCQTMKQMANWLPCFSSYSKKRFGQVVRIGCSVRSVWCSRLSLLLKCCGILGNSFRLFVSKSPRNKRRIRKFLYLLGVREDWKNGSKT